MQVIPLAQHQQVVEALQDQIDELHQLRLALAILLVKGAGGRVAIPASFEVTLSNTSYIMESRDPHTGDRIFETFEKPTDGAVH